MTKTRERNAILIFVAPRPQKFAVIGDQGADEKCGEDVETDPAATRVFLGCGSRLAQRSHWRGRRPTVLSAIPAYDSETVVPQIYCATTPTNSFWTVAASKNVA